MEDKPLLMPAHAWMPPAYGLGDITAIQALANGTADAAQQKRALKWIIHQVCCTYDLSYRPGENSETVFAEGKRFVGLQLVKALHLNTAALKQLV